jgi:hypothetical protein
VVREFRRVLTGAAHGEILVPLLQSIFYQADFSGFTIPINGFSDRPPDGIFHPSTHPTWPSRMLYWYLKEPKRLIRDSWEMPGVLAVTQGSYWHAFLQTIMLRNNLIKNMSPDKKYPHEQAEFFVEDKATGSAGHLDGVLNPDILPIPYPTGLEIKTINGIGMSGMPKTAPESTERLNWLKTKHPVYYAQAQEYLRMSGLPQQRFLFITIDYPFPMNEIVVPYDPPFALSIANKYHQVRHAVRLSSPPLPCCESLSSQAKKCCARSVCPVGLAR